MSEVVERINSLVQQFDARVQAAPADSWGNVAPCEGWTARDVVVHVANNFFRIGGTLSAATIREVRDSDDIVTVWGEARDLFLGTVGTADLSQPVPGPFGPMPAEQVIGRLVANDVLVHTWDLARATGGDETLDQDAVAGAYSGLKPMDAMIRQPGFFGPKIEAPEGSDLQTEFLSFLGRQV